MKSRTDDAQAQLLDALAACYADPERFVRMAYPWRQPGQLENYDGPDAWQAEALREIGREVRRRKFDGLHAVDPVREAFASGHGIGKSTFVAWMVDWLMSTRPHAKGTVTANTFVQLETRTWAQIQKWTRLCITADWWTVTTSRMYHRDYPETWFCSAQSCKEENSEAFAGQHAADSSSFYIFDEASAVPDKIYAVAEGGLTDGEAHIYLFGNPTRNTGTFYRACFGSAQHRWLHRSIDSRTSVFTNKAQIAQWIEDYGEDSDFVRVRVRGLPPAASELQYIDAQRVQEAQRRRVEVLDDEPLVAGMDVSGGGSAWTVIRFRRGRDARSIAPIRITGEQSRDRSFLIARAAEALRDNHNGYRVAALFVDSAFGAAIVERLHTLGYHNAIEVNFGGQSPDSHYANQRAYMWSQLKDWLPKGAIDELTALESGLQGPGYHINRANKLVLESKQDMQKRGEASPDDADALALTFAAPVAPLAPESGYDAYDGGGYGSDGWMA